MRDEQVPPPGETAWPERVAAAATGAGLPDPTGGGRAAAVNNLDGLLAPWLAQCAHHDGGGRPEECVCPRGDVRPVLRQIVHALIAAGHRIERLHATVERERSWRAADALDLAAVALRRIAASPTDLTKFLAAAGLGPDAHPAQVVRAAACWMEDGGPAREEALR